MTSNRLKIIVWKDSSSSSSSLDFGSFQDVVVMEQSPPLKTGQDVDTARFIVCLNLMRATPDKALLIVRDTAALMYSVKVLEEVLNFLLNQENVSTVLLTKYNDQCSDYAENISINNTPLQWSYPSQGHGIDAVFFSSEALQNIDSTVLVGGNGYDEVIDTEPSSIMNSPMSSPRFSTVPIVSSMKLVDAFQTWMLRNQITVSTVSPNLFSSPHTDAITCSMDPIRLNETNTSSTSSSTNNSTYSEPSNITMTDVYNTPSNSEIMLYSWWFWLIIFILLIILLLLVLFAYRYRFPTLVVVDEDFVTVQ